MLAACTQGNSWQLSRDIWVAIDLSEVTKPIQGFGTSLRIGSDQAILCHRLIGGPNIYTKYILWSFLPFLLPSQGVLTTVPHPSTSALSLCMFLSVQVPSWLFPILGYWLSPILGYFQTLSVTCVVAAPQLCSSSQLPAPSQSMVRPAGLSWCGRAGPLRWTECRRPVQPSMSD